jgi:hypothetical protein
MTLWLLGRCDIIYARERTVEYKGLVFDNPNSSGSLH